MKALDIAGELFAGLSIGFAMTALFAPQLLRWML